MDWQGPSAFATLLPFPGFRKERRMEKKCQENEKHLRRRECWAINAWWHSSPLLLSSTCLLLLCSSSFFNLGSGRSSSRGGWHVPKSVGEAFGLPSQAPRGLRPALIPWKLITSSLVRRSSMMGKLPRETACTPLLNLPWYCTVAVECQLCCRELSSSTVTWRPK